MASSISTARRRKALQLPLPHPEARTLATCPLVDACYLGMAGPRGEAREHLPKSKQDQDALGRVCSSRDLPAPAPPPGPTLPRSSWTPSPSPAPSQALLPMPLGGAPGAPWGLRAPWGSLSWVHRVGSRIPWAPECPPAHGTGALTELHQQGAVLPQGQAQGALAQHQDPILLGDLLLGGLFLSAPRPRALSPQAGGRKQQQQREQELAVHGSAGPRGRGQIRGPGAKPQLPRGTQSQSWEDKATRLPPSRPQGRGGRQKRHPGH